jgi:hypothetical protein
MRWCLWFLVVPQGYLAADWLFALGAPRVDVGALLCVFLALFAEPGALPGLLVGAAVGRALVDDATVPVQMLVLGVPVAALLPLRKLFWRQQAWWQVATAAAFAVAVPRLSGLCGRWFGQPSSAAVDGVVVLATALLGPLLLLLLRRLPPLRAFLEHAV